MMYGSSRVEEWFERVRSAVCGGRLVWVRVSE